MATDFSDLGGVPVSSGTIDFSDLGGHAVDPSPTQPDQSFGDAALSAGKRLLVDVPEKVASSISSPKNLYETTGSYWPAAGATVGQTLAPGIGAAVGGGLGQITRNIAGIAYGDPAAPTTAVDAAVPAMGQTIVAGLPELDGVKNTAKFFGRRALGLTKGMIKRLPGGVSQANQAAQEMLEQGVIKPLSGASSTLDRAQAVANRSGSAIGDTLSKAGSNALDTNALGVEVANQLTPSYTGGAYDAQKRIADEIVSTIGAHGNGPIDFRSAQDLKNTLKQMAGANWNTDNLKAAMYQRAYGIVSNAIERGLGQAAETGTIQSSAIPKYLANKKTYGASQIAIEGLRDKAASEASNSILSLRGAAIGAAGLANGNIPLALESLGGWELGRRFGAGTVAALINRISQSPSPIRNLALSKLVNSILAAQKSNENAQGAYSQ